jgi:hypothetical protein
MRIDYNKGGADKKGVETGNLGKAIFYARSRTPPGYKSIDLLPTPPPDAMISPLFFRQVFYSEEF